MKKIIFNSALIISLGACTQINPGIETSTDGYVEKNGKLSIEAELPNETKGEKSSWNIGGEKDDAVFVQNNRLSTDISSGTNELIYNIEIQTPGKYRIWSHIKADTLTNGVVVSIQQEEMTIQPKALPEGGFVWVNENASYSFDTGTYELRVKLKDEEVKLDKLMLLRDQRQVPDGNVKKSMVREESDEIISKLLAGREEQKQLVPFNVIYGDYSMADAYTLQSKLADILRHDLGEVVGYKMAFATESAMEKFKLNEPVYGPLFRKQQIGNGGSVDLTEFMQFHIENEIAFVTTEITKKVNSVDELKTHVKSVHLGFDMADGRFNRANGREGINDFVASGGGAHRFAIGDALDGTNRDLMDLVLRIHQNKQLIYEGNSNEAMGNPWNALLWIVNDLLENGHPIKDGFVFLTGKVDAPYTPDGKDALGVYLGTCEGFPNVQCSVK